MKRTSVRLDETLSVNLDCLARLKGVPQGEIIRKALQAYMVRHGLQPDKMPTLKASVTYLEEE